jgi:hypothetical protein
MTAGFLCQIAHVKHWEEAFRREQTLPKGLQDPHNHDLPRLRVSIGPHQTVAKSAHDFYKR